MNGAKSGADGGINIPIELPPEIQERLRQPICADLRLRQPKEMSLTLPSGGSIPAVGDFTQGIPTDCSLGFSLLVQLGPLLGSLECVIKILNLVKPLSDIVQGLPFPPAKAIKEFGEAVPPVLECALAFTPQGGVVLFVKDILALIARLVRCLADQLESVIGLYKTIAEQMDAAQGNPQLLANLQCAQENAQITSDAALKSFAPVLVILQLVAPLVEIAGLGAIEPPELGGAENVEQAEQVAAVLEEFADTLELVAGIG